MTSILKSAQIAVAHMRDRTRLADLFAPAGLRLPQVHLPGNPVSVLEVVPAE
jgi:hypothetical protein